MCGSRGGTRGPDPPPLKKHTNLRFVSNSGPDPLKNHEATEPAFSVGPLSARQRKMAFRWRADDGPLIVVFESSHPSSTNKKTSKLDPL